MKFIQATDEPFDAGRMDVILVGVKAWQVSEAAQAMGPMVGPDTFVVPLQNGVEAPTRLAEVLGERHVVGGLCWISSFSPEPGQIHQAGIAFGEINNQPSQRCQLLLSVFHNAGVKTEIPADIQIAMWEKFTFITAISGVGGVTRSPVGVTRSLPETRRLLIGAMQEIQAVAEAYQIEISHDYISRTITFIDNLLEGSQPSMQRDLIAGRPSELAYQNGVVVRLGRARGVPTPINEFLYASLLPQKKRARGEVGF